MGSSSDQITCFLINPSTTADVYVYGAQLEVGGPATTTQITTTKPQGIYLWGIQAPQAAPSLSFASAAGNSSTSSPAAWAPNTAYSLNDLIIDSNGDLELVTTAGTSGASQPVWNGLGGTTSDGINNSIVQTNSGFASASTITVSFQSNVTHNNTLFAFLFGDIPNTGVTIAVSDSQSNSWTEVAKTNAGDQHIALYSVLASAAAGATSVTATFSSPAATGIWLGIAEIEGLTALETSQTNSSRNYSGNLFNTGVVTTTNASAFLLTFAATLNNAGSGYELLTAPIGYQALGVQTGVQGAPGTAHWISLGVFCEFLSSVSTINPAWSITNPGLANGLSGITAAYTTSIGTLVWTNVGPITTVSSTQYNSGLTPAVGYTYYYAFMNSQTGHISNVSVTSGSTGASDTSTGKLVAQVISVSGVGMQTTPGPVGPVIGGQSAFADLYDQDPQVDTIVVFRNTDGGPYFYQIASFANPGSSGSAGTWTLADVAPDDGVSVSTTVVLNGGSPTTITEALNLEIFAPIGLLNSPPPAGLVNFDYFAGRMFGSSGSFVYYNTAADNASLLNITQNGVAPESWAPANEIPFNTSVTRIAAVGGGLFTCTVLDSWFVTGTNLLSGGFNPQKVLINHGLLSYNALGIDGSTIYLYTSDKQFLCVNANSGSVEFGFPIGDLLEQNFNPSTAYIVRHVSGSQDNAVYLGDGATQWVRLNPNQQGASMSGEQTPVWSPPANFTATLGGIGAIASMEVAPGDIRLLVGQLTNGPVLYRSLTTFTDDGDVYSWDATFGSILLTTPGKLAEAESVTTEMNAILGATQCGVAVLLDEIGEYGSVSFESLASFVNDPPQLNASQSVLSNRFYLSQGTQPPVCRHMQIQLTSGTVEGEQQDTADVLLGLTVRGALISEQV